MSTTSHNTICLLTSNKHLTGLAATLQLIVLLGSVPSKLVRLVEMIMTDQKFVVSVQNTLTEPLIYLKLGCLFRRWSLTLPLSHLCVSSTSEDLKTSTALRLLHIPPIQRSEEDNSALRGLCDPQWNTPPVLAWIII